MWEWIKNVGNGIVNVFSGKSWNGDDPAKIKADAQAALLEQQAQYSQLVNNYSDALTSANKKNNTLKWVALAAGAAGVGYILVTSNRPRRYR